MRFLPVFMIFIAISIGSPSNAAAQTLIDKYSGLISAELASAFVDRSLDHIHEMNCDDANMCRKTDDSERRNPPIGVIEGKAAMAHGITSALAAWCGLDFRRSFLPMIAFGKRHKGMNERQLMLMTWIHGSFSKMQLTAYRERGRCPDNFKAQLDSQLPKLPARRQ